MAKKKDLNAPVAKSVLYYDKDETEQFLQGYDASLEQKMPFDPLFKKFVEIIRKFKDFADGENLYENKVEFVRHNIEIMANSKTREKFSLWFEDVVENDFPMELAEDVYSRLIWETYIAQINNIDATDLSFEEKLALRPKKLSTTKNSTQLVNLLDIDMTEEINNLEKYTTGDLELDKTVSFNETNLVVIAARPGVGKSLFMLQTTIANAKRGIKSLFVSLEMSVKSVNERIINHISQRDIREENKDENGVLDVVGFNKDIKSFMNTDEYKKIAENMQILVIKKSSGESIMTEIEEAIKEGEYKVVCVDYLQLIKYSTLDEWASFRATTKELKSLAFRYNMVMISGSQVSRSSTERGLDLTQLFGSSSIESDADIVIGLEAAVERRQGQDGIVFVKVMKNREGDLGSSKYGINYPTGSIYVMNDAY